MNKTTASRGESLAGDLLTGAAEIARFGGWDRGAVYHMAAVGQLPTFKLNGRITARKSALRRHIEKLEAEALAAAE